MPHISVKMLQGRTEQQKKRVAEAVANALQEALQIGDSHISVSIEDYTAIEWQDVFRAEVTDKPHTQYKAPAYDPKDLL